MTIAQSKTISSLCAPVRVQVLLQQVFKMSFFIYTGLKSLLPFVNSIIIPVIFRSTPPSRPNKVGLKCQSARPYVLYVRPSVRPSTQKVYSISMIFGM